MRSRRPRTGAYTRTTGHVQSGVNSPGVRYQLSLRIAATRNSQRKGVRFAEDYLELESLRHRGMEPAGLEPAPSALQTPRSPN